MDTLLWVAAARRGAVRARSVGATDVPEPDACGRCAARGRRARAPISTNRAALTSSTWRRIVSAASPRGSPSSFSTARPT
jgi:hypothetical protein